MALLSSDQLTLVELTKRTNNGVLVDIAEQLNKVNPILDDAPYVEANGSTNHTTTYRLSLPTGSWRKTNEGVEREASRTQQLVETMGLLESYSQIDEFLVELAADKARFRYSEDIAFVEGMGQTFATALIYGNNAGAPEQINGLATRYNSTNDANVWSAGGSGSDTTSAWIIQWGPDCHLVYPKNSQAGLQAVNDGLLTIYDANSNPYKAYQTHFKMRAGLVIRDYRCVQRIANIETSGASNIFDEDYFIRALRKMPNGGAGAVIYMNDTLLAQLDIVAKDKTNVTYSPDAPFGRPQTLLLGKPVKQLDALVNTETAIS